MYFLSSQEVLDCLCSDVNIEMELVVLLLDPDYNESPTMSIEEIVCDEVLLKYAAGML